jgi:hypothetical protein
VPPVGRAADDLRFEDRDAVRAAFDAAVATAPVARRTWFATIGLAAALLVAAGGWALSVAASARFDPRSSPLGRALGPQLTDYVASVSQRRARLREGEDAAGDFTLSRDRAQTEVAAALGPEMGSALVDLFRAYQSAALAPGYDEDRLRALSAEMQRYNGALRHARQPYFMDYLELSDGEPILSSYYVAEERTARVDRSEIPLLRVQRLDTLNRALAAVGYTSPRMGAALVTLDLLERNLVVVLAPALAEGGVATLVDPPTRESRAPWIAEIEGAAGAVMRRDWQAVRSPELDRLIALLARRDRIFSDWASRLALTKVTVSRPVRLVASDRLERLEGIASRSTLAEWEDLNKELDGDAMRRAFERALGMLAERVERHELQHQIDFRRGLVAVPAELRALFRLAEDAPVNPNGNAARCRDELSADLAAIALGPDLASTELTLVAAAVFHRDAWATPHAYAAAVVLPVVARELGGQEATLVGADGFDRGRAKELFVAIAAHSGAEIARAAAGAYARLFGTPLPSYELGPSTKSRAWRH